MADPLSIATGVTGLLSFGIQISESLLKFYQAYKSQDKNISHTANKLENLLTMLQSLETTLKTRRFQSDEKDLVQSVNRSIWDCEEIITELQEEGKKYDRAVTSGLDGFKETVKLAGRRAAHPFRQSTLQKLDEDISEIRNNVAVALNILQLGDQKVIHDDLTELKSLVEHIQEHQISSTVRQWLRAPDPTVNHNSLRTKHHTGSGMWFVRGDAFQTWLAQENSFLWLNGFAGCGKSVLCSTAIQETFFQRHHHIGVGIAFFYFTFSDEAKQDESGMIRALLLQLAGQHEDCQADLTSLYSTYQSRTPPPEVLMEYLQRMARRFEHVYILLDALDESPRYEKREGILAVLQTMRQWGLAGLHLLVTSRDEPDIRRSFSPLSDEEIILRNQEIDEDIQNYIAFELKSNKNLQRWRGYHDHIQQALNHRAQGV
ncbi:hypothetical protein P170DRAFT_74300 [Aspergillus steynii IBT 23096]|uniref:NACHT domain-containing protein n=1 Tax=Aspergillus steynii IBT 23096 TaxID=1392250 RepID=A0A2I2FRF4_9EURO|nr:uncharacterized protein P170DRAFT_74300 [Aspergillus steynii IBT 23096]PLB43213.1 hypothetical protein P170DRAFT_74300 [Aspergillus steynii IBT 23096]